MTSTNGADTRRAVAEFRQAGYSVAEIASDLGVHRSTIYRRSAFADVDPFKIFGQPEPALPF